MDAVRDVVLEYVNKEYVEDDSEPVTNDTPLISGGIVDSFSMVSLKRFLENRYKIQIPDNRATPETFDSVDKIAAVIDELTGKHD
jgi:acyl carrier protein